MRANQGKDDLAEGFAYVKTDADIVIDAMEEARRIIAEHLKPCSIQMPAARTIHLLVMVLDRPDLIAALTRMKAGRGLRVIK
jgi:hypothetical protein